MNASGLSAELPNITVVIVTYRSSDVISDCLTSLIASAHPRLRIVVVDNASPDDTVTRINIWADGMGIDVEERSDRDRPGRPGGEQIYLIRSKANRGFAGGVNLGLCHALCDPETDLFWILNPDCTIEHGSASLLAKFAAVDPTAGLIGHRIRYRSLGGAIQSDGGIVCRWTGRCRNLNQGLQEAPTNVPRRDFVSGASMVVTRRFIESVGFMREDYFLYYEEVDWAARRSGFQISWCDEVTTWHEGGTAIGSGRPGKAASPLAQYFNFRNRMRFLWRFNRLALPLGYVYSLYKITRSTVSGDLKGAAAGFRGLNGLPPSSGVRAALTPDPGSSGNRRRLAAKTGRKPIHQSTRHEPHQRRRVG